MSTTPPVEIQGGVSVGFEAVGETLEENFAQQHEHGQGATG